MSELEGTYALQVSCQLKPGSRLQISRALGALALIIIYSNIMALNRSEQAACTFVAQVWELHHIWLFITFPSLMQKLYDMSTLQEFIVHKFSQGACKKDVKDSCWFSYMNHCLMSGAPLEEDIMLCLAKLKLESSERKQVVLWTMMIIWWQFSQLISSSVIVQSQKQPALHVLTGTLLLH